jgi:hypothetical protein
MERELAQEQQNKSSQTIYFHILTQKVLFNFTITPTWHNIVIHARTGRAMDQ